jgi:predicted transcriptional regulator
MRISRGLVPLQDIMPHWYRFTIRQIEYSNDIYTPTDIASVEKARNTIIQLCLQRPDDFISYLTQPPRNPRKPEFSYRNTRLGACAKFVSGATSIKAYHKLDSLLRIETSCYNLRKISVKRSMKTNSGDTVVRTAPMTRSLLDMNLFIQFARNANNRMAHRLESFWSQSYSRKNLQSVSQRTEDQKINFSGLNLFAKRDAQILQSAGSPQHDLCGFKRSDIANGTGLNRSQAGYAIRKLRAHGLIKKINGTNRYFLTKKGRGATASALLIEHLVLTPIMAAS